MSDPRPSGDGRAGDGRAGDGPERGVSAFERETAIERIDTGAGGASRWRTYVHGSWCIGDTANGGYALSPVLRALGELAGHPDPVSFTTHFLRPTAGDRAAEIDARVVRVGRSTSVVRGAMRQEGRERLLVTAVFGDLARRDGNDDDPAGDGFAPAPPGPGELPPPEACVDRRALAQGVELPVLDRVDVRVHPDHAVAGGTDRSELAGWIRFADRTRAPVTALGLFADAFPPSLYPLLGRVGWVPTLELTVHPRRRPAPGWIAARFACDDLESSGGGTMVESGTLWDSTGRVVARSRQLGVLRTS